MCEAGVVFVKLTHGSALNVSEWAGCLRSKEEPCSTFVVCNADVLLLKTSPLPPLTAFLNILKLYHVISFNLFCFKVWQPYLNLNMMCKYFSLS